MNNYLDFSGSKLCELPILDDKEAKIYSQGKGWSFFNIYFLRELKDIYLLLKEEPYTNRKSFTHSVESKIIPTKKEWNERRVLEHLNALQDINLISSNFNIQKNIFFSSKINSELSIEDKQEFTKIFFNYFRFKEIMSWFINPSKEYHENNFEKIDESTVKASSKPVFFFSRLTRFTDSFFYELKDNPNLFYINPEMEHLMRFWDVFIKWGISLDFMEKFNLSLFSYKTIDDKEISCCYFINPEKINIDLVKFLQEEFSEKYIFIPEVVLKIALKYRFCIKNIKEFILKSSLSQKNRITIERTSEIFITQDRGEKRSRNFTYFYPIHKDSYISHLVIR